MQDFGQMNRAVLAVHQIQREGQGAGATSATSAGPTRYLINAEFQGTADGPMMVMLNLKLWKQQLILTVPQLQE